MCPSHAHQTLFELMVFNLSTEIIVLEVFLKGLVSVLYLNTTPTISLELTKNRSIITLHRLGAASKSLFTKSATKRLLKSGYLLANSWLLTGYWPAT